MVFCGTVEICWLVPLKTIIDSANDMAAISDSHLNMDIYSLNNEPFS